MTIIDAAVAIGQESPEALSLLSAIFAYNEGERKRMDGLLETWAQRDRASYWAMRHGVLAALKSAEFGGTTRDYERVLDRVQNAVHNSSYGPIHEWYCNAVAERAAEGQHFTEPPMHEFYDRAWDTGFA